MLGLEAREEKRGKEVKNSTDKKNKKQKSLSSLRYRVLNMKCPFSPHAPREKAGVEMHPLRVIKYK